MNTELRTGEFASGVGLSSAPSFKERRIMEFVPENTVIFVVRNSIFKLLQ